jgi:hypothetical protein
VNPDGEPATIRRHTEGRERRDLDIVGSRARKFEKGTGQLNYGPGKPRTRKGIGYVNQRIGRLSLSARAGKRFRIEAVPCGDDPSKAASAERGREEAP